MTANARLLVLISLACIAPLPACTDAGAVRRQSVPGGDAERGGRRIVDYGCGSCHVIPGIPAANGRVGPPLTDFADRAYVAGILVNEPDAVVSWIQNPPAHRPGTAMPVLGVTEADARDIAAYLYTLGSSGLGPPFLIPVRRLPGH